MEEVFEFGATPAFEITKSYRDENGQMFIEGLASSISVDQAGERMSPEAIAKMAARLVDKPLRSEHGKGWDDRLGSIVKADVVRDKDGNPALWIKAKLHDWSSKAKDLFTLLINGAKMGLSVAGRINPGGIVNELASNLGKFVPTYHDVEPTEVSVTDHPANLDAFCVAVAKSFEKEVTGANESKPKEYEDVATGDFLDPENYKYPADEAHLMPALRYFNHEGQRSDGGYTPDKWASMGNKLAGKLGDEYYYDAESEKVLKKETKKQREEVTEMKEKGNLVSNKVSPEVASFAKEFGKDIEDKVEKTEKVEEVEKGSSSDGSQSPSSLDSSSAGSTSGISTSSDPSTVSMADSSTSSDSSTTPSSTDSGSTVSSSDSGSSSSDSSSDSSSSGSSTSTPSTSDLLSQLSSIKTSLDSSSSSSDSSDELTSCLASLSRAITEVQTALEKKDNKSPVSSTPTSSDNTSIGKVADKLGELTEAIVEREKKLQEREDKMDELVKSVSERLSQPSEKKSYATVKKTFVGQEEEQDPKEVKKSRDEMIETLKQDPDVNFKDMLAYKDFGTLPKKYETK